MPDDVHPQIQAILDRAAELEIPKLQNLTTQSGRALMDQMTAARREAFPPPEVHEVEDRSTGAGYNHVPVRIYRVSDQDRAPVIVFYHGGGHVIGGLESHDIAARFLAQASGATLVSVDYRMAPEHRFPIAVEDAFQAARWVSENAETLRIDRDRLALCGDSAGGNLAAVVALMARDSGAFPVAAQALIYPVVECHDRSASYARYGTGYGVLEAETVDWFMDRYLPETEQRKDWRASPIRAASHAGLPPALVLTAECDVLHDEGVAYADVLRAAGGVAKHLECPGMTHGFFTYLGLVDETETAHRSVAEFLKKAWA